MKNVPELLVPGWAGRLSTGRGQQQGRYTAFLAREAYTPSTGTGSELKSVLGIRILRVRMFLGLQDPDPLVTGMDPNPAPPAPDPSLF